MYRIGANNDSLFPKPGAHTEAHSECDVDCLPVSIRFEFYNGETAQARLVK